MVDIEARIGVICGNWAVAWQDWQEDIVLSTGPFRRRPHPRCMGGRSAEVLMIVCLSSGLMTVLVGLGFESEKLVTSGSLPHMIPTGTALSHRLGLARAPL